MYAIPQLSGVPLMQADRDWGAFWHAEFPSTDVDRRRILSEARVKTLMSYRHTQAFVRTGEIAE